MTSHNSSSVSFVRNLNNFAIVSALLYIPSGNVCYSFLSVSSPAFLIFLVDRDLTVFCDFCRHFVHFPLKRVCLIHCPILGGWFSLSAFNFWCWIWCYIFWLLTLCYMKCWPWNPTFQSLLSFPELLKSWLLFCYCDQIYDMNSMKGGNTHYD